MRRQQDRNAEPGHPLTSKTRDPWARRSGMTVHARSGEIQELSPMERQSPLLAVPRVISRVPGTVYLSRSFTRAVQRDKSISISEPDAPRTRRR